jgi:cathepsin L
MTEKDYPYQPARGLCLFNLSKAVGTIRYLHWGKSGNEDDMATKIQAIGPAAVSIEANHRAFMHYHGGIFDYGGCHGNLDHSVLCCGWGRQGNITFWIVKNSWGKHWGEKGFIRMIRKNNQCGIASDVLIPSG